MLNIPPPPPENRTVCEIMRKKVQNACHCNKDYENVPQYYIIHITLLILYYYPPYVFLH
jgi:hypothetical protein